MWIVTNLIVGTIIGLLLWKKFGGVFEAFYGGLMWTLSIYFCLYIIYDNRQIDDFYKIYDSKDYCFLNVQNYNEDRQLIIDYHYFPHALETSLSEKTFCRIDLYQGGNTPYRSHWMNKENLEIVTIDGVVPCFKRLKAIKEKNPPLIYKLFLCPLSMEKKVKEFKGTLYLPENPYWRNCEIPQFLEYDILKEVKTN